MIQYAKGNLLEASTEVLVNTVNCVGVMGKGIALQFKQAFPENYEKYRQTCEHGEVRLGKMFVYATGNLVGTKFIVNFPTKQHWKGKSKIQDVDRGLDELARFIQEHRIKSI